MKIQILLLIFISTIFAQKDSSIHLLKQISNTMSLTDVMDHYESVCNYDVTVTIGGNMFSRAGIKAADDWLNKSYAKIINSIKDTVKINALKKAQRSWLQYRNDNCNSKIATSGWGGSGRHMRSNRTFIDMTMQRTIELRNEYAYLFKNEIKKSDLIGVWQNINLPQEIIKFSIINNALILKTESENIKCSFSNGILSFDTNSTKFNGEWYLFINHILNNKGEWKISLNDRSDGGGFRKSYIKIFE